LVRSVATILVRAACRRIVASPEPRIAAYSTGPRQRRGGGEAALQSRHADGDVLPLRLRREPVRIRDHEDGREATGLRVDVRRVEVAAVRPVAEVPARRERSITRRGVAEGDGARGR